MSQHSLRRTGQLVVRRHSPKRRRAWLVMSAIGVCLLAYSTYEWGRYRSGYSVSAALKERRDFEAKIDALQEENAALRANVANAETSREVERKSYKNVEGTLNELQTQVQRQNDELAFYRAIVAPEDGVGSLRVQRLEVRRASVAGRYVMQLVLIQSMRQDRSVAGGVKIEVVGTRAKEPVKYLLRELNSSAPESNELAFSFRYFQKLETEVTLPEGVTPETVNVTVRSTRESPVQQTFPWRVLSAS